MNKQQLAGCVIVNEQGKILLMHRQTERRQQWETPGGRVEAGEVSADIAAREVEEEIGASVSIIRKLGTKEFEEDGFTLEYTWFLASIRDGTPEIMEPEKHDDMRYFTWDEVINLEKSLSLNVKNLLQEYLAGKLDLY